MNVNRFLHFSSWWKRAKWSMKSKKCIMSTLQSKCNRKGNVSLVFASFCLWSNKMIKAYSCAHYGELCNTHTYTCTQITWPFIVNTLAIAPLFVCFYAHFVSLRINLFMGLLCSAWSNSLFLPLLAAAAAAAIVGLHFIINWIIESWKNDH